MLSKCVAEKIWNIAFEFGIGDVGHSCVSFINFFYYIGSNDDLSSHYSFLLWIWEITCFSAYVQFVLVLKKRNCQVDEVSACNWPYTNVMHVMHFEYIELLLQYFDIF